MKGLFIESRLFEKRREELINDEALTALQTDLLNDLKTGDVIRGTGGLRKCRVAAKGHGKRGGARVIYYYLEEKRRFYLLLIYAKNQYGDLTDKQRHELKQVMWDWKNEQN